MSWTHDRLLLRVENPDARAFYEAEAVSARWSTRELGRQINTLLFERFALSRDKVGVIALSRKGHEITRPSDLVKDPLVLEFTGLRQDEQFRESDCAVKIFGLSATNIRIPGLSTGYNRGRPPGVSVPGVDGGSAVKSEDQGSVTRWIDDLKRGDAAATGRLWERYFDRLARLARERLRALPRTIADEEDIALSAFESFFAGVARGRFPQLDDRDDLWGILVTIAQCKVADHAERQNRQKRGGGRILDEAALARPAGEGPGIGEFAGAEPTPEAVLATTEEIRRLFGLLPEASLRLIALLKMEGHTNDEIASIIDCALRSVERKLERIRNLWIAGGAS